MRKDQRSFFLQGKAVQELQDLRFSQKYSQSFLECDDVSEGE